VFVFLSLPDVLWLFFDIRADALDGAFFLAAIAITIWFYRLIVQRVRDAGQRKGIAYLACIPIANLLFFIYLLFPGTKADAPTIQVFE